MKKAISEKDVENKIKKWLEKNNHWYFKVHGGLFQKSGVPDIIACVKGKFVAIEVKRPKGGIVSKLQIAQMNKIRECEGITGVARTLEEFLEILKEGGLI